MKTLGIYIHIPFCLSKCQYCGFYSMPGVDEGKQWEYCERLIEDIVEYGKTYADGYTVDTIFIGGGTPSILPGEYIGSILDAIKANFHVKQNAEMTIESNPKTLTKEKLLQYRQFGINRLSIGLQSLHGTMLKNLGRTHSVIDFCENYQLARDCGFQNINVDLMFAIPNHTMEIWEDTLEKIIEMKPEHISFYSLQIEEGTPFYDMYKQGLFDQISDELDRQMYHKAIEQLKASGYLHYEISNCALPGFECKHNLKYWSMEDYLGIGDCASSYMNGIRFAEGPNPEYHENSFADETAEYVFTGLRKTEGISLDVFAERFDRELWDVFGDRREELNEFFQRGLLIEDNRWLRLSEEGLDISNQIMAIFV